MRDMLRQRFMTVAGALLQKMSTSSWACAPKPSSAIICPTTVTLGSQTDNIACHLNTATCHSASRWSFQLATGTSRTWSMKVAPCFNVLGFRSTVSATSPDVPPKVLSNGRLKLPSKELRKLLSGFIKSFQKPVSQKCFTPSGWSATRANPKVFSAEYPGITVAAAFAPWELHDRASMSSRDMPKKSWTSCEKPGTALSCPTEGPSMSFAISVSRCMLSECSISRAKFSAAACASKTAAWASNAWNPSSRSSSGTS